MRCPRCGGEMMMHGGRDAGGGFAGFYACEVCPLRFDERADSMLGLLSRLAARITEYKAAGSGDG